MSEAPRSAAEPGTRNGKGETPRSRQGGETKIDPTIALRGREKIPT
jgi:hypothetical protein